MIESIAGTFATLKRNIRELYEGEDSASVRFRYGSFDHSIEVSRVQDKRLSPHRLGA
jgi:hypothetical protein